MGAGRDRFGACKSKLQTSSQLQRHTQSKPVDDSVMRSYDMGWDFRGNSEGVLMCRIGLWRVIRFRKVVPENPPPKSFSSRRANPTWQYSPRYKH